MHVIVTGNMGYVGPLVVQELRSRYPGIRITGIDQGYFAHCLTATGSLPETRVDVQLFGDVRTLDKSVFHDVDALVFLAAISNDPIGERFAAVTDQINHVACENIASAARSAGVRSVVFASSCSVYGFSESGDCDETSSVNPLTAYARSKVACEQALVALASEDFQVTCLRFATACGMSPRLRLDLVLNDFVANALVTGTITILSDGTPWRPLIHVADMGRAISWAVSRCDSAPSLVVNVGRNDWNFRVRDLADAVAAVLPGTSISVNPLAAPDKRSYRVKFERFDEIAPADARPRETLEGTIMGLVEGIRAFTKVAHLEANFRSDPHVIRLRTLLEHLETGRLTEQLHWT